MICVARGSVLLLTDAPRTHRSTKCASTWIDGLAAMHECLDAQRSALAPECAEKLPRDLGAKAATKGIGESRPKWLSHLWTYAKVEFTSGGAKGVSGYVATKSALDLGAAGFSPAVVIPDTCAAALAAEPGSDAATLTPACASTLAAPVVVWESLTPKWMGGKAADVRTKAGDALVFVSAPTPFIPALGGFHHHHWRKHVHGPRHGRHADHHTGFVAMVSSMFGRHHQRATIKMSRRQVDAQDPQELPLGPGATTPTTDAKKVDFDYDDFEEVDAFVVLSHVLTLAVMLLIACCCGSCCTRCRLRRRYAARIAALEQLVEDAAMSSAVAQSLAESSVVGTAAAAPARVAVDAGYKAPFLPVASFA